MKISIFGSGYVGLVTGICFAEQGNEVMCVDIDSSKINALKDKGYIDEARRVEMNQNHYNREIINANSVIALVGTTGVTSGPHLHFEIWKGNELIDPRDVIEEYRRKDVSIRKQ